VSGRVVVVGATGTIGRPLSAELVRRGHGLVVFSRDPDRAQQTVPGGDTYVEWDPEQLSAECRHQVDQATAVIYLAGGSLFEGKRHDRHDVEQETVSRIRGMDNLIKAFGDRPPAVFIAASSVGYYGYRARTDMELDETSPPGGGWWGQSGAAIERSALTARDLGVRTVVFRTGYVLTEESLATKVAQFGRHMGEWIGVGSGWTPWIHIADEVALLVVSVEQPSYHGPVNATSPNPVRARTFARTLGRVLGRHAWIPAPTPFVRMGLGVVTDIIVKGKRVIPSAAIANGFEFRYPGLKNALRDLLHQKTPE
jgi:uncharacterized protein (TIGR01777 family)